MRSAYNVLTTVVQGHSYSKLFVNRKTTLKRTHVSKTFTRRHLFYFLKQPFSKQRILNSYLGFTSLAVALISFSFRIWILSVISVSFWREAGESCLMGILDGSLELSFLLIAIGDLFTGVKGHWPLFFSTASSFIMGILEANFELCFLSSAILDNRIGLGGWYGFLGSASI